MFLLPTHLRDMLERRQKGLKWRAFLHGEHLIKTVREIAASQQRSEQDVYDDFIESGMKAFNDKQKYENIWATLSTREQEVTALTCLGYRSYEIAGALSISYETVRTHSKHVYAKFGLSRKELCLALAHWNFEAWWEDHQV